MKTMVGEAVITILFGGNSVLPAFASSFEGGPTMGKSPLREFTSLWRVLYHVGPGIPDNWFLKFNINEGVLADM
jgi:hypothetical protein